MDVPPNPSRRAFLRHLALAAESSAVLAAMPWLAPLKAGPAGPAPSDRVRLGVIGVGSRGRFLTLNLLNTEGVEVAAVCDDYPPHYDRAIELTGGNARAFADYRELLAMPDLDGVVIATPFHEHARMAIDAMQAGKHVFCEKSLAKTYDECRAIADTQRATGRIFQIGHQRLFSLRFLKALDLIQAGAIGEITQIRAFWHRNNDWRRPVPVDRNHPDWPALDRKINWRMYRDYSGGLMAELASHHLQVANWFLGSPPESVSGSGSINYWKDGREVYDNVNVVYRYPGGVHVLYDSLISNRRHGLEIQIMGPQGTLEPESGKVYAEQLPPAPGIVQLINNIERGIFDSIPIGGASWVPDLKVDSKGRYLTDEPPSSDGSDVQLVAFANSIREGRPIPGMVEHAVHAGVATLMGIQAMDEQRIVTWPEEVVV